MKYLTIILAILLFSCNSKQDETVEINSQLIGSWMSLEDSLFTITFTDSLKLDYYDKDVASTSTYSVTSDTLMAIDQELNDVMKYRIDDLSDSTLSMIYLDRGNTLNFKRINNSHVDSIKRQ